MQEVFVNLSIKVIYGKIYLFDKVLHFSIMRKNLGKTFFLICVQNVCTENNISITYDEDIKMSSQIYLSPEAYTLLSLLCEEYRARIANGGIPAEAKAFGAGTQIKKDFKLECSLEELDERCEELAEYRSINAVFTYEEGLIGLYLFNRGIEYIR